MSNNVIKQLIDFRIMGSHRNLFYQVNKFFYFILKPLQNLINKFRNQIHPKKFLYKDLKLNLKYNDYQQYLEYNQQRKQDIFHSLNYFNRNLQLLKYNFYYQLIFRNSPHKYHKLYKVNYFLRLPLQNSVIMQLLGLYFYKKYYHLYQDKFRNHLSKLYNQFLCLLQHYNLSYFVLKYIKHCVM